MPFTSRMRLPVKGLLNKIKEHLFHLAQLCLKQTCSTCHPIEGEDMGIYESHASKLLRFLKGRSKAYCLQDLPLGELQVVAS